MIVPDINLLLYAFNRQSPSYQQARAWLEAVLSGAEPIGLAWIVLLGFLRISTSNRVLPQPLTGEQALDLIAQWLARPNVVILQPGPRHLELLRDLLAAVGTAGNLTSDAHLAAIALEQGAVIYSTDKDFDRFPGFRWHNPLAN